MGSLIKAYGLLRENIVATTRATSTPF